jgi:hypothetical protein
MQKMNNDIQEQYLNSLARVAAGLNVIAPNLNEVRTHLQAIASAFERDPAALAKWPGLPKKVNGIQEQMKKDAAYMSGFQQRLRDAATIVDDIITRPNQPT